MTTSEQQTKKTTKQNIIRGKVLVERTPKLQIILVFEN